MTAKYCLPIIKPTKNEVLAAIEGHTSNYDFFEIWLDYIDDLDSQFVARLIQQLRGKLIVVFRRQNLEPPTMPVPDRLEYLTQFSGTPVLVDLDINDQATELQTIREQKLSIQTIVSYHNYQETPPDSEVQNIVKKILVWRPTILKISTMCQTERDSLRLLDLLLKTKITDQKCIILGTGKHGTITRIFGTLWGNQMIFAPQNSEEESAPDQLTRAQLETILNIVKS